MALFDDWLANWFTGGTADLQRQHSEADERLQQRIDPGTYDIDDEIVPVAWAECKAYNRGNSGGDGAAMASDL